MNIAGIILNALALKARMFENSTRDPLRAQEKALFKYLRRNQNTEYGRKYAFSGIKSIGEFRKNVPLSGYEDIRPYVDRMTGGERNILTHDKPVFFGITSGTTGQPKLIPVTKYSRDRKSDLMDLWAYYVCRDHPNIFNGKILAIISPEVKALTSAGIPYGPEDGHAYNNLPELVKKYYSLPYDLFYINDYDARYYCILRVAMEHNVTTIATLNPSTIVLLCQRIGGVQDRVIKDIEKGTLEKGLAVPDRIRRKIEARLRPNPKRAAELAAILKAKGELLPRDFWPELELVECWKGGTVKIYIKELAPYFGKVPFRDFGCLSTEARSSVPISDEDAGGVLAVSTNFYEFIPLEDRDRADKRILLCNELEKGGKYFIIVTTAGGLYRYNMDDIIKVNGFFNRTPVIEFLQKGHNAVSLTGEKVYERHVTEAVNVASARIDVRIRHFCASIEMTNPPRYIFLVEFEAEPDAGGKKNFIRAIEEELCRENSEYDDTRKQQLLGHPVLKVVRGGGFEAYRRKRVDRGAHDTQFKLTELVRDPEFQKNFNITEVI